MREAMDSGFEWNSMRERFVSALLFNLKENLLNHFSPCFGGWGTQRFARYGPLLLCSELSVGLRLEERKKKKQVMFTRVILSSGNSVVLGIV